MRLLRLKLEIDWFLITANKVALFAIAVSGLAFCMWLVG